MYINYVLRLQYCSDKDNTLLEIFFGFCKNKLCKKKKKTRGSFIWVPKFI